MEKLIDQYLEIEKQRGKKSENLVGKLKEYTSRFKVFISNEKSQKIEILKQKQKDAKTYDQWFNILKMLDILTDREKWKKEEKSEFYDYQIVKESLSEMRKVRKEKKIKQLMYIIKNQWSRNFGNIDNYSLYEKSFVGTKSLIEEYIEECILCLEYLVNDQEEEISKEDVLRTLDQTRRKMGRTALVFSGGSAFGIFHIGVLMTLFEIELFPRIVSGSSAGSIIASIVCSYDDNETLNFLYNISDKKFNVFGMLEDQKFISSQKAKNFLNILSHLIRFGTFFDIRGLKQTMIDFLGDLTFKEAYNRTGRILNITVSPASLHENTKLLNYLTAPNCLVWSAVCASCSLPGLFPSTLIYEKNPITNKIHEWNDDIKLKYVDGSVDNDLPIIRLLEMFNVDNIIAVQVNPHISPILKLSSISIMALSESKFSMLFKKILDKFYDFLSCEIVHYLKIINEIDVYKNLTSKLISVFSQSYSGNITILPNYKFSDFRKVFENPTTEFLLDFIIRGARECWPKITLIKNQCGVEFALDKAITDIKAFLVTKKNTNNNGCGNINLDTIKNKQSINFFMSMNREIYVNFYSPMFNSDKSYHFTESDNKTLMISQNDEKKKGVKGYYSKIISLDSDNIDKKSQLNYKSSFLPMLSLINSKSKSNFFLNCNTKNNDTFFTSEKPKKIEKKISRTRSFSDMISLHKFNY